jgi:predicted phosphodiesterase
MNKTIIVADVHGRDQWKQIVAQEKDADTVIFLGDYFDSFNISAVEQMHNFKEIVEFKETSFTNAGTDDQHKTRVIMLIGNHDYHYMQGISEQYSGYQHKLAPSIQQILEENKQHLQMAYQMGEFLFTHAGVSSEFMDSVFGKGGWKTEEIVDLLNEQFKYKPQTFGFGLAVDVTKALWLDPYGDNREQSPIWIRPRSLMAANRETLRKQVIQVVGHTGVTTMTGQENMSGGRYFLTDCLETSGEYLIIEDNNIRIGTWKN